MVKQGFFGGGSFISRTLVGESVFLFIAQI